MPFYRSGHNLFQHEFSYAHKIKNIKNKSLSQNRTVRMYTITECSEVESKTFICIAEKLLYFYISNSITVKSCSILGFCRHICIFSQSANLLSLFDSVIFRSVSLSFFPCMSVLSMYLFHF